MHSIIVKTKLLKKGKLKLPETIFYVDNLFVFYVLQHLNQLIYLDIPLMSLFFLMLLKVSLYNWQK